MPKRREPTSAASALRTSMGPLMRQVRKFSAMRRCSELLAEDFDGLAAPYDVRLAPAPGSGRTGSRGSGDSGDSGNVGLADMQTMYFYVLNKTVELALEQRKRQLIKDINEALPYPMVEEFRFDTVSKERIVRQLNILALEPD